MVRVAVVRGARGLAVGALHRAAPAEGERRRPPLHALHVRHGPPPPRPGRAPPRQRPASPSSRSRSESESGGGLEGEGGGRGRPDSGGRGGRHRVRGAWGGVRTRGPGFPSDLSPFCTSWSGKVGHLQRPAWSKRDALLPAASSRRCAPRMDAGEGLSRGPRAEQSGDPALAPPLPPEAGRTRPGNQLAHSCPEGRDEVLPLERRGLP